MTRYTAHIVHNETTVNAFTKTQFAVFDRKKRSGIYLAAIALMIAAMLIPLGELFSVSCMLIGCLLLVDVSHIPKRTAQSILKGNPSLGKVEYEFSGRDIQVKEKNTQATIMYSDIICLIEDRSYFYIFTDPKIVYMLDKTSIKPKNPEDFRASVEKKCDLKFKSPRSAFKASIFSIAKNAKYHKK